MSYLISAPNVCETIVSSAASGSLIGEGLVMRNVP